MSSTTASKKTPCVAASSDQAAKRVRRTPASPAKKSPFEEFYDKLEKELAQMGDGCGYVVLRNMKVKPDDVDEEDWEEDYDQMSSEERTEIHDNMTAEQVGAMRLILVPKSRNADLESMGKLVLGDQYGDCLMMFNTSFSHEVVNAYSILQRKINSTKDPSRKFNFLFGFTYYLHKYDIWMHDHESGFVTEYGGGKMVTGLARMWKNLFKKFSPEELGVDTEYTLPGTRAFLEDFKTTIEEINTYDEPKFKFNWK